MTEDERQQQCKIAGAIASLIWSWAALIAGAVLALWQGYSAVLLGVLAFGLFRLGKPPPD